LPLAFAAINCLSTHNFCRTHFLYYAHLRRVVSRTHNNGLSHVLLIPFQYNYTVSTIPARAHECAIGYRGNLLGFVVISLARRCGQMTYAWKSKVFAVAARDDDDDELLFSWSSHTAGLIIHCTRVELMPIERRSMGLCHVAPRSTWWSITVAAIDIIIIGANLRVLWKRPKFN
jgi:hypothetical protein